MKNIYRILFALVFAAGLQACEREAVEEETGEGIKVSIQCAADTKATRDGVGNENLIKTVDYFLFSGDGSTGVYRYKGRIEPTATSYFTFYIQSSFVPNGSYTVFVIVNYPGSDSDLGSSLPDAPDSERKTYEQLKSIALSEAVNTTFTSYSGGKFSVIDDDDLALVMTGSDTFTVDDTQRPLVGTASVDLRRLASKVTMNFYLKDEIVRTSGNITETWTPMVDDGGVRLYLCNGNNHHLMKGENPAGADSLSLFDYQPCTDLVRIDGKTDFTNAFTCQAFYTYPEAWTYGSHEEPYIKLIVPWTMTRTSGGSTTTSQKEFYYKVMLPTTKFEQNTWYNLIQDITQLGSSTDNDAVNLICSYQVADWGIEDIVASTLVQGYYLDVAKENMNLTIYSDKVDIPYTSSGTVEISNLSVSYVNFQTGAVVTLPNPENYIALYNDHVHIERQINSDYSGSSYDVSSYTFTFTLHLMAADDNAYDKTVTVTQEPPLYISQRTSDGRVWVNGNAYSGNSSYSNVWDNSGVTTNSDANHYHNLGVVVRPSDVNGSGDNNSQDLYEIAATILDMTINYDGTSTKVVIGDPRGAAVSYDPDITGLTNYLPAGEDTKNVIAPRFIVASSYGKTTACSYEAAQRRCAAYQENGYPAGRWRIPTIAEIEFAIKLNSDSRIKSLFGPDAAQGYWAGGKEVRPTGGFVDLSGVNVSYSNNNGYRYNSGGTNYSCYVRCVYDSWYWGNEQHSSYNSSSPAWIGYQTSL